jgi:rhodanese-related sulfurtransferase
MPDIASARNPVTEFAPAASPEARAHFQRLLALETDCWDVHETLKREQPGFVLLDVRDPDSYRAGHIPRAINLMPGKITQAGLAEFPADALFVVYCTGPDCNGADKAALRLASLGRAVKKMLGGFWGWTELGFEIETG